MTWTYSGDPSSTSRDQVRFLVGDTDSTKPQVTDEEISWLLSQSGSNVYKAASDAALAIAAKYGRLVDEAVGDLRYSYSQRQKQYLDLAKDLLSRASSRTGIPYAGGMTKTDKDIDRDNDDQIKPTFSRGQFDIEGTDEDTTDLESDS